MPRARTPRGTRRWRWARLALCRTTFEDEEDASVLAEELAPILVQQGCILQRQGKVDDALALYEAALKSE